MTRTGAGTPRLDPRRAAVVALAAALASACSDPAPTATPPVVRPLAFTDVTDASGLAMTITSGHTPPTQILEVKGGGLALFDRDGDGDLDLFVPNGATLDDPENGPGARLWDNDGALRFRDATGELAFRRWGMGVAIGDTDADGDDDVFVACFGRDGLLENRGPSGLREAAPSSTGLASEAWGMAAAFGDLDADGDLDLYVANYLAFDPADPPPATNFLGVPVFGGPRPLVPQPDVLYRNDGGRFVDVTVESGCGAVPASYGLGVVILDFDADGRQDVLVGNDSMRNFLFRNDGALRFTDVGVESGIATDADGSDQATMGIAIADVDGDRTPDVFSSNFQGDSNTLHVNRGSLSFHDGTASLRLGVVSRPFLGWAALFGDFDQDTDEDLVVFNGHVYSDTTARELGTTRAQTPLYFAREGRSFRRLDRSDAGAWIDVPLCARGATAGDLDGDGDLDLVVGQIGGPVRVLRNDGTIGRGMLVELAGSPGNPHALGARIELTSGSLELTRWIYTGGGYLSAGPQSAHFGLPADVERVDFVVVWPDGATTRHPDVRVTAHVTLRRD